MDYRDDPVSGDIMYNVDPWNAVAFDPFLTKRDLSDCSFVARRKFLSRTEVISLLPDKEDVIRSLPWGSRDDKFTYMPYARQWGMQKLLNYNEYWRSKWETKEVLVDMETGETMEWKGPTTIRLKQMGDTGSLQTGQTPSQSLLVMAQIRAPQFMMGKPGLLTLIILVG